MIEARELCVTIGRARILDAVSLAAPAGKLTGPDRPERRGKVDRAQVPDGEIRPDGGTVHALRPPDRLLVGG